ncbi:laccase [Vararia minispora EC-137]|uniref:Laccase n=1 Tax=Vararia minispora EC-137 TaxID=1314806 RepID=A0ACB8Q7J8_9AGAM|nr:laccase [Vararia minispora EC-137]
MVRSFWSALALSLVLSAHTSLAATVSTTLTISNADITPDGFTRPAVLVNGVFPGPTIFGNKSDNFQITVQNGLSNADMAVVTAVHWHGIEPRRVSDSNSHSANWADGVADVTQCPIIPGNSFLYTFESVDQAGTFWYHSHYSTQYCDGLRGVFIIYDPNDPQKSLYDVDDESTIITLSDWYHYLAKDTPRIPEPNSTLINGVGRYNNGLNEGPLVPLAVVGVQQGIRYRFRVVATSCDTNFMFSIDSHNLTIIEVDGNSVQPHTVNQIQILAAQRYSVVVNANQPVANYWIRAIRSENNATIVQTINGGMNAAIFRYSGAPNAEPTAAPDFTYNLLNEADLTPLESTPPPAADGVFNLNVTYNPDNLGTYFVNGVTFQSPPVPVLLQIMSGANASDLLPQGSVYTVQRNKAYDIVVPAGAAGGPHPLHLHGHSFWVIGSAGQPENEVNPVIRDTVSMGNPGETVHIRFETNNPGPWFFHCHIDWHLAVGFAIVFVEDIADINTVEAPSQAWGNLCPAYNQFIGSSTS